MQSKTIVKNEINQLGQVCELWENGVIIETGEALSPVGTKARRISSAIPPMKRSGNRILCSCPVDIEISPGNNKKDPRGEPSVSFESVHCRKDGSRINVSILVSPLRDDSSEICAFSFLAHNTADREQEKELFTALNTEFPDRYLYCSKRKIHLHQPPVRENNRL